MASVLSCSALGAVRPACAARATRTRAVRAVVPARGVAPGPSSGIPAFKQAIAAAPVARKSVRGTFRCNAAEEGYVEEKGAAPETNWGAEFGILCLRLGVATFMIHNGLDKLQDPEGFSKFVVAEYFPFLPQPLIMTYLAAIAEIVCSGTLALGLLTRLSSLSLLGTMGAAVYFHIADSGLEGFPLGVVKNHAYAYETAALYFFVYFFFLCNGGGALSIDNALKKDE